MINGEKNSDLAVLNLEKVSAQLCELVEPIVGTPTFSLLDK